MKKCSTAWPTSSRRSTATSSTPTPTIRKLLERKDIDAVSIATPNHTHALIAIAAAQAGKHVYVEKPASHNIWEGRQMVQAARQNNRIMQCGTQSRSSTSLKEAVDFVRSGELGKIKYALGTCYKPRPSIGKLDKPLEIPSTIDYDLWCGPAAKEDLYRKQLHYDWHWDLQHRQRRHGQPGHPPDGHRPLVPRRERRSPRGRSASAADSATKTPATRPTRRSSISTTRPHR